MFIEAQIDMALIKAAEDVMDYVRGVVRQELKDQGHENTGRLTREAEVKVKATGEIIKGLLFLNDYYVHLEYPLPADRVPYERGSGARSSKVVDALTRFFRTLGKSPEEAKSASFATLNKWKREGRPTKASFRFSKNGKRTGFLEASVQKIESEIIETFGDFADNFVSGAVVNALEKVRAKFKA